MSDARQRDLAPENWNLGDRFLLEQGFTVAFLGWQFDVPPGDGLSLTVPTAPVSGVVRASAVTVSRSGPGGAIGLAYCAADASQPDATLTFGQRSRSPRRSLPRESWQFAPDGCVGPACRWLRCRAQRSDLQGDRIARCRPWPGGRARLRLVSQVRRRMRRRCARTRR